MPSTRDIPSVEDLRQAFHNGVASLDTRSDRHDGSKWDDWAGIGALAFNRLALHDADLFEAVYDGSAEGQDLTNRLEVRYGVARDLDDYGTGTALIQRPNTSAGAGWFYEGTRVLVYGVAGNATAATYAVSADTHVGATATSFSLPIRAIVTGSGTAIDTSSTGLFCRIDDPVWDTSWTIQRVQCADGTDFEKAADYRARVYQGRLDARVGYAKTIIQACVDAGAVQVAAFASNYSGDSNDYGMSVVYVGDAGYNASPSLIRACSVALEGWRVMGADLAVLPMTQSRLTIKANVYLWDDPGLVDTVDLQSAQQSSLVQYFSGRSGGFAYRLDAMAGAMTATSNEVQSVSFVTPSSDLPVMSGSPPVFPNTLTRWSLVPSDIALTYLGPQ